MSKRTYLPKRSCPVCKETGFLYVREKDGVIFCSNREEVHSEAYGVWKEWVYCHFREKPTMIN